MRFVHCCSNAHFIALATELCILTQPRGTVQSLSTLVARLENQKDLKEKVNKAGFDNAKDFVEALEKKAGKK